ncbi:MAG: ankyrin repeat domain-containing protein [Gammaproteobacteria bacterium]|nr:ankyrin repeat domain-containing protein [Gammaproteobacteria bacterium]
MIFGLALLLVTASRITIAQSAPSLSEISNYDGLHKAAHQNDIDSILALVKAGADIEARDDSGRTPVIIAAFASHDESVEALAKAGADMNALDSRAYDIVTIAAVANDVEMLDLALELGANSGNITSPYDGTALIAAAHLGHHAVVERLIRAKAPLNHINNLGWTALIEAVVLGDGGADHIETVRLLLDADADRTIGDRQGVTPLEHAKSRGYIDMVRLLENDS